MPHRSKFKVEITVFHSLFVAQFSWGITTGGCVSNIHPSICLYILCRVTYRSLVQEFDSLVHNLWLHSSSTLLRVYTGRSWYLQMIVSEVHTVPKALTESSLLAQLSLYLTHTFVCLFVRSLTCLTEKPQIKLNTLSLGPTWSQYIICVYIIFVPTVTVHGLI